MKRNHSKQRDCILEFLSTRKDHPTADVVYMNVRKQLPNISLGTVYRNLTLLSENGEILRLRVGDGTDHFDADVSPHYHFICKKCRSVLDLPSMNLDPINQMAAEHFDGEIEGHCTYFYGLCGHCTIKHETQYEEEKEIKK